MKGHLPDREPVKPSVIESIGDHIMLEDNLQFGDLSRAIIEGDNNVLAAFTFRKNRGKLEVIAVGGVELVAVSIEPDYLAGVIYLNRHAVPVIDLQMKYGAGKTEISDTACVLLAETKKRDQSYSIGIIVSGISDILMIAGARLDCDAEAGPNEFTYKTGDSRGLVNILTNIDKITKTLDLTIFHNTFTNPNM